MIKIEVKTFDKSIKSIIVSGHANYSEYGKDIVCAGITAIVSGALNALDTMQKNNCELIVKKDLIKINVLNNSEHIQIILEVIYHQLKTVFLQYQDYIQFKEVV